MKTCSVPKTEALTQLLVEWVTSDMRPLNIVNDGGLQRVLHFLEPGFAVPSRTHIASIVKRKHADGVDELKSLLQGAEKVAITTDGWTSKAVRSFSTFTVHFLDSEWRLQSYVLGTRPLDGSHTAVNIATQFSDIVAEYGIADKLAGVVHDEAANMMAASRQLATKYDLHSVVCAAHMLQTCLRHTLDSSKSVQKLLAESRRLVSHFHHSSNATSMLNAQQVQQSKDNVPLRVVQDVPTRWNSTFYMLERLVKLRPHLTAVLADPVKTPKPEHRALLLKEKRWATAEELIDILKPAEKATRLLSGQSYLTASCILPIVMLLKNMAEASATKAQQDKESGLKQLCRKLSQEISGKFHLDPLDLSSFQVVAAALDPRSRSLPFLDADGRKAVKLDLLQLCTGSAEAEGSAAEPAAKRAPQPQDMVNHMEAVDMFFGTASAEEVSLSIKLEQEVEAYMSEAPAPGAADPLQWWKSNAARLPHLAKVAKAVLCVPATSVPSERVFSAAGHIVSKRRAGLSEDSVDALIFLQQNKSLKVHAISAVPAELRPPLPQHTPIDLDVVLEDELPALPSLG